LERRVKRHKLAIRAAGRGIVAEQVDELICVVGGCQVVVD
jgi:hypothetical protein